MRFPRRAFLATLALPAWAQTKAAPPAAGSEWGRYQDPSTEFDVLRLTSPDYESRLVSSPARPIDKRSRTLLYATNRSGSWQPWTVDLSNGRPKPLATVEDFNPASLTLSADDRQAFFQSGQSLSAIALSTPAPKDLAELRQGFQLSGPLAPTEDGTSLFFTETNGSTSEIRRLRLPKGVPETVVEHPAGILDATPNPKRATILWRTPQGELWLSAFDGAGKRQVETAPGRVLQAHWSPDGQSILYLFESADSTQLNAIREQGLDSRADSLISKTSQFGAFQRNSNATVFLGASRGKASPNVLLLLRATRREFTLCEHKASVPAGLPLAFSPNSQRVVFQSDRHGKPCLYLMNVEKLIEKTDS
jgi:oligogalacturonide lyase